MFCSRINCPVLSTSSRFKFQMLNPRTITHTITALSMWQVARSLHIAFRAVWAVAWLDSALSWFYANSFAMQLSH